MATATGTATIDFGSDPGTNEAFVDVTGQSTISATSKVDAFIMAHDTSSNHTASDHRWFSCVVGLTCGTPTAATGFRIYATSQQKLSGQYAVRWVWAD